MASTTRLLKVLRSFPEWRILALRDPDSATIVDLLHVEIRKTPQGDQCVLSGSLKHTRAQHAMPVKDLRACLKDLDLPVMIASAQGTGLYPMTGYNDRISTGTEMVILLDAE